MAKYERVLSLLPSIFATERTSLLAEVARALGGPIEEADSLLFRIQRAHRLRVAESPVDIVRLAAALNLDAQHFADLLENEVLEREARLALMRRRVERVARLHLEGLGTPWAVVEAAAILLDAEVVTTPEHPQRLHRLDADGYSHVADVEVGDGERRSRSRIYLHENPLRRRTVEPVDRYPLDAWLVSSDNAETAPGRFIIRGVGERTVVPSVFCPDTGESIQFHGVVPDGSTLVIDGDDGASLDGRPVDDWISFDTGAFADFDTLGNGRFVVENDGAPKSPRMPFGGDMTHLFTPPYRRMKPVPSVAHGTSEWRFGVRQGIYDHCQADFAVYAIPNEPRGRFDEDPGFDGAVFDFLPSGIAGMSWDERIPAAFKLLVPPRLPIPGGDQPQFAAPDLGRLAAFVERCKAAGVHAFIDTTKPAWIVGESVIRGQGGPEDEGDLLLPTVLRDQEDDLFIPLDPTTAPSAL